MKSPPCTGGSPSPACVRCVRPRRQTILGKREHCIQLRSQAGLPLHIYPGPSHKANEDTGMQEMDRDLVAESTKVFYCKVGTVTEYESETSQSPQTQTQKWASFSDPSRWSRVNGQGVRSGLQSLLCLKESATYSWLVYI